MQKNSFKKFALAGFFFILVAALGNLLLQVSSESSLDYFQKGLQPEQSDPESSQQLAEAERSQTIAIYIATGTAVLVTIAFIVIAFKRKE